MVINEHFSGAWYWLVAGFVGRHRRSDVINHAGAAVLRLLAARTGLTGGLSAWHR
jgi:hypothetical protein